MKKAVLVYGLAGGLLIAVLRLVEYRFLVVEHSIEIYGAIIAALFAVAGGRPGGVSDSGSYVNLGPRSNASYRHSAS